MITSRRRQRMDNAQQRVNELTARLNDGAVMTAEQRNEIEWNLERAQEQLENARWLVNLHEEER